MPNSSRFKFARNRQTTVQRVGNEALICTCRLIDTLCEMGVRVTVKLPDMEIAGVAGEIARCYDPAEHAALAELSSLTGIRVGPGMTKIFKSTVSPTTADSQMLFMMEEACHGAILTFTKEMATQAPDDVELDSEIFRNMVKANIRLYNRCAAYGPGSSLVEGIEPPK